MLAVALLVGGCTSGVATSSTRPTAGPASAPPYVAPTPFPSCADRVRALLSPEQLVGQLFLAGVDASRPESAAVAIRAGGLGGVFLAGRWHGGTVALAASTNLMQAAAVPASGPFARLWIAADQEGGLVQALAGFGFSAIPTGAAQAAMAPEALRAAAAQWGGELGQAGVNLDLAPVLDVVSPADAGSNQAIGIPERELGHDPAAVSAHGSAVVKGMAAAGIGTAGKHFPGLGRVRGNTDTSSSGVSDPAMTADDPDLQPFREAIFAGTAFVMVSLATYPRLDSTQPAAFSASVVDGVLRGRLSYSGTVISDDLGNARAVAAVLAPQRAVRFLEAGGDVVLDVGGGGVGDMEAAVLNRASADPAFAARVRTSASRVLAGKARAGLLRCPPPGRQPA